jgi:antitoxin HigA-1
MKKRADKMLDPIPPGEILLEAFMKPLGISINHLARDIDVPPGRISQILCAKRAMTVDTALRLASILVFRRSLVDLQVDYDMRVWHARRSGRTGASHQRSSGGLKVRMWRMPWARRWGIDPFMNGVDPRSPGFKRSGLRSESENGACRIEPWSPSQCHQSLHPITTSAFAIGTTFFFSTRICTARVPDGATPMRAIT